MFISRFSPGINSYDCSPIFSLSSFQTDIFIGASNPESPARHTPISTYCIASPLSGESGAVSPLRKGVLLMPIIAFNLTVEMPFDSPLRRFFGKLPNSVGAPTGVLIFFLTAAGISVGLFLKVKPLENIVGASFCRGVGNYLPDGRRIGHRL